jgi:hypothetical protein
VYHQWTFTAAVGGGGAVNNAFEVHNIQHTKYAGPSLGTVLSQTLLCNYQQKVKTSLLRSIFHIIGPDRWELVSTCIYHCYFEPTSVTYRVPGTENLIPPILSEVWISGVIGHQRYDTFREDWEPIKPLCECISKNMLGLQEQTSQNNGHNFISFKPFKWEIF